MHGSAAAGPQVPGDADLIIEKGPVNQAPGSFSLFYVSQNSQNLAGPVHVAACILSCSFLVFIGVLSRQIRVLVPQLSFGNHKLSGIVSATFRKFTYLETVVLTI